MSEDRLEEIKKNRSVISVSQQNWLISELEKCRAEVRRLNALLAYTGVNSRG